MSTGALVLLLCVARAARYAIVISGEAGENTQFYGVYRDTCQFVTYLTTCKLDKIWVMCGPSVAWREAFKTEAELFYMRIGEHFRDKGQQVEAQVAELKRTVFQPGDTVVVYIRSHGMRIGGRFQGPMYHNGNALVPSYGNTMMSWTCCSIRNK